MKALTTRRSILRGILGTTVSLGGTGFLGQRASASIPTGTYLNPLDSSQFWFRRFDLADPATAGADAQLSIRLGQSGGFATSYFATLAFLEGYKSSRPGDYEDLLVNSAKIPESPNRPKLTLKMLAEHRRVGVQANAPFSVGSTSPFRSSLTTRPFNVERSAPIEITDADLGKILPSADRFQLCRPLEKTGIPDVFSQVQRVLARPTNTFRNPIGVTSPEDLTPWPEFQKEFQKEVRSDFDAYNPTLVHEIDPLNTSRLTAFDGQGKLNLGFLSVPLLSSSFEDGVDQGALAALAYTATMEAHALIGGTAPQGSATEKANQLLSSYKRADTLMRAFGPESVFSSGMDHGGVRPAIRIKLIATIASDNGLRTIEAQTPFVPFTADGVISKDLRSAYFTSNGILLNALHENFNTLESLQEAPLTTASFPEATFEGCEELHRSSDRIVRRIVAAGGGKAELKSVMVVPESTSPWTFSGVAAALSNTYLLSLTKPELLNTEESRFKFRMAAMRSSSDLMRRSTAKFATKEAFNNATINAAPLIEYASGYRASVVLGDRVADLAAESAGARKVYVNLRKTMPEFFPELATDQFLTADQIATQVLMFGDRVRLEIESLRLKVQELSTRLASYEEFATKLKEVLDQMSGDLSGVHDTEALNAFRDRSSNLLKSFGAALDATQKAALGSLQGLLNSVVVVGVNIEANVKANVKASVDINANVCGIGGKG